MHDQYRSNQYNIDVLISIASSRNDNLTAIQRPHHRKTTYLLIQSSVFIQPTQSCNVRGFSKLGAQTEIFVRKLELIFETRVMLGEHF